MVRQDFCVAVSTSHVTNVISVGIDSKKGITVTKEDVLDLEGSKGEANYIMKWPGSKVQSYIKIVDLKGINGNYSAEASGTWVTVLGLECRGLVPTAWKVGRDFSAESTEGHVFEEVDLSEGDWADYDEEHDLSVSVMNVESKVE
jgi:hypothetical protein